MTYLIVKANRMSRLTKRAEKQFKTKHVINGLLRNKAEKKIFFKGFSQGAQ